MTMHRTLLQLIILEISQNPFLQGQTEDLCLELPCMYQLHGRPQEHLSVAVGRAEQRPVWSDINHLQGSFQLSSTSKISCFWTSAGKRTSKVTIKVPMTVAEVASHVADIANSAESSGSIGVKIQAFAKLLQLVMAWSSTAQGQQVCLAHSQALSSQVLTRRHSDSRIHASIHL